MVEVDGRWSTAPKGHRIIWKSAPKGEAPVPVEADIPVETDIPLELDLVLEAEEGVAAPPEERRTLDRRVNRYAVAYKGKERRRNQDRRKNFGRKESAAS